MPTTSSSSRGGKMQASRERAKGARTDACEVPHLSWKKKNVVAAEPCTSCDGARTWPKTARSTGSPRIHPEFLGLEGELSAAAGRDYLTTATATQLLRLQVRADGDLPLANARQVNSYVLSARRRGCGQVTRPVPSSMGI
ncbi:hypothetical protein Purlil1_8970 [Purpureocillium lilacinum]|uniref:Uncharacterized protein n=1 Tax=Purpureocillium lilacinum TaxID=33203 RepID=A0ABR0BRG8_PURLI|nr:hypothetical protein Purlil1_8970 [Purpureocillium lilacinum]